MINKQWLIKITGENDLWYDSEERTYRRRMYCPYCGKVSGCQCYEELDDAEIDIANEINYTCSSKCMLENGEWDYIEDALSEAGFKRKVSELTEDESAKCINYCLLDDDKRYDVLDAINILEIRKTTWELKHKDRIKILESFDESDVDDVCYILDIDLCRNIKDLTEEEAESVLNILIEDADVDFEIPIGDVCK